MIQKSTVLFGLVLLVSLLATPVATAQTPAPGPHFGASAFPRRNTELRGMYSINRFTELSKSSKKYNGIDETSGFNLFSLAYTDVFPYLPNIKKSKNFTFTLHYGLGPTQDQPSRWLQNEFLHELWGLDKVPVREARDATDYSTGASATYWHDANRSSQDDRSVTTFLGIGFDAGSIYQEAYAHAGLAVHWPKHRLRVALLHRLGFPSAGNAFDEVADLNNLSQVHIAYVPRDFESSCCIWQWLGNPEAGVILTHDSGLFVDDRDNPISTWFASFRMAWRTGLEFEIWNDVVNGTDYGPTMGFMFSFDLIAFANLIR